MFSHHIEYHPKRSDFLNALFAAYLEEGIDNKGQVFKKHDHYWNRWRPAVSGFSLAGFALISFLLFVLTHQTPFLGAFAFCGIFSAYFLAIVLWKVSQALDDFSELRSAGVFGVLRFDENGFQLSNSNAVIPWYAFSHFSEYRHLILLHIGPGAKSKPINDRLAIIKQPITAFDAKIAESLTGPRFKWAVFPKRFFSREQLEGFRAALTANLPDDSPADLVRHEARTKAVLEGEEP